MAPRRSEGWFFREMSVRVRRPSLSALDHSPLALPTVARPVDVGVHVHMRPIRSIRPHVKAVVNATGQRSIYVRIDVHVRSVVCIRPHVEVSSVMGVMIAAPPGTGLSRRRAAGEQARGDGGQQEELGPTQHGKVSLKYNRGKERTLRRREPSVSCDTARPRPFPPTILAGLPRVG